ncbi:hypothetical protein BFJ72_g8502 [Fusarium proliferatum]|uniref:Prenyltransferase alpha-alpha toroid domain-containing protein n=1 Tax=Gibberella intermedia TaxID=948311 RepID=A0A420T2Y2_GIBIN|nr:hypothetical protein BFJ72_g8502 [Fusarium proliferatum]
MIAHIKRGQTYDGGVAESSQHESHAGYAYCAIGALSLLDRPLDSTSPHPPEEALKRGVPNREGLLHFLASRPFAYLAKEEEEDEVEENFLESKAGEIDLGHIGFNGRWNKKADTCYCWWVGGTLAMLGNSTIINVIPSRRYLLDITQHRIGGFSKSVGGPPDMYHSYLGLAALATMGDNDLKELDVGLCCRNPRASSTIRAKRLRKEAIDACSGTEAIRICVESISRHIATANKHGLINGKRKAAAGSNGVIRSRQPALTCWIQPG